MLRCKLGNDRRAGTGVTHLLLMLGLTSACMVATPTQDTPSTSSEISGTVWFGTSDASDRPAAGVEIGVGAGHLRFNVPTQHADENGRFVIPLQQSIDGIDALFLEATFLVDGPEAAQTRVNFRIAVDDPRDARIELALPVPTRCDIVEPASIADADGCGTALLPDLVPVVVDFGQGASSPVGADSVSVDRTTRQGRILLRLGSATANLGRGPLHMIPGAPTASGQLPTYQRLWTDTHQFVDIQTGEFVFHTGHDHFHLDAFERYRLLTRDGEPVAVGDKLSFCLIDSLQVDSDQHNRGLGVFTSSTCEDAGSQQVLNPGWADYYSPSLEDQWIDITGVEPGDYLVEIVADPDDLLIESDETNNRATFPITIAAEDLPAP